MSAEQRPHSEPVYVVNALESAWNEHDLDALTSLFHSDALVVLEPALEKSAAEGRYQGLAAIKDLLRLHVPGASIATRGLDVQGDTATWEFEQGSDRLRALGITSVAGRARATVSGGRISDLRLTFSPQTVGRLRAIRAKDQR